jgi:hypothetical protein
MTAVQPLKDNPKHPTNVADLKVSTLLSAKMIK